ncbi:MAG TPA: DUF2207 domain-containing protein [Candidatus Saccharimonadales bacterium]|nr:DUF2207 domain-containing protein [Candidatus Saccharimonadales bacterium]
MKRFLLGLGGFLLAVGSVLGGTPVARAEGVNDFIISNFDVDYHLARDNDGRSTLKTVERITAVFPSFDQNHGLERALPKEYDGHTTNLIIQSVTDETGIPLSYSDANSTSETTVLRIGDADTYVHGEKTYVITYAQHDVTRYFGDTNDDEFYWDVNGTGWTQQIQRVQARVFIDEAIGSSVTGKTSCYQGYVGSKDACSSTSNGTPMVFSSTRVLQSGENVSFAVGFTPHTFGEYQQTASEKFWAAVVMIWLVALVIGSFAALLAIVWMSVVRNRLMKRARGRSTIIPEYLPPKDTSVTVSAFVLKRSTAAMTAQILDLAVRHFVKIYQTKEKSFMRLPEYELEIVKDVSRLSEEEHRLLESLYGSKKPSVGSRFSMKKLQGDYSIGKRLNKDRESLKNRVRNIYDLYEKAAIEAKGFQRAAMVMLILGILTFSPLLVIAAVVGFVYAYTAWPLTEKGAELRDYLLGLKLYIDVAETDRITMLQSPEGAEKVGQIDENNPGQLVKLYERVLPYAVLFGVEKEWLKQLGAYYDTTNSQPDWYAGNSAFNAVVFASALGSFSDQSTSYESSSSSSSGGSDGGGFSGGGGGGGGGGGW